MERAQYLAVANQRHLSAVADRLTEKAMERFGLVGSWHYRRVESAPVFGIRIWAEKPTEAWTVTWFDRETPSFWMIFWSTELSGGEPEALWRELAAFAGDFGRDTVLCTTGDGGTAVYRLLRPQTGERAQVRIGQDGDVQAEHLERFFDGMPRKYQRPVPRTEELAGPDGAAAQARFAAACGLPRVTELAPSSVLRAAMEGRLRRPFERLELVRDPAYLTYDYRAEYDTVLSAVWDLLAPLGYRRRRNAFFRITKETGWMECFQFTKSRFRLDPTHETRFTVDLQWGFLPAGRTVPPPADLRQMIAPVDGVSAERIGRITHGQDWWYELYPGVRTQDVVDGLLKDLRQGLIFLDQKRAASLKSEIQD